MAEFSDADKGSPAPKAGPVLTIQASPPPTTTDSPANSAQEFLKLKADVARLKQNRLAKFGAVVAVIAAVISVLNGGVTLHDTIFKSPQTAVVNGPILLMAYSASNRILKITFGLSLQNLGNADDSITNIYGRVTDQRTAAFAPLSDFKCTIGNSAQSMPFAVPKGANTIATCTVSSILATLSSEPFSTSGTKQFALSLVRGSTSELSSSQCFNLDAKTAEDIATKSTSFRRQFSFQPCSKEAQ